MRYFIMFLLMAACTTNNTVGSIRSGGDAEQPPEIVVNPARGTKDDTTIETARKVPVRKAAASAAKEKGVPVSICSVEERPDRIQLEIFEKIECLLEGTK